jgi:saccharopine dehydrogenase (NADP+, L-glutamate forming)/spermidine synthase
LVSYLSQHNFYVIVANRTLENAQKLTQGIKNTEAKALDIETAEGQRVLEEVVPQVDAVVSMLPYLFHIMAAKCAMKYKKHFFTTSYTTDAMRELNSIAVENGVVIINECGVDPGTDHMSAMRVIDHARQHGGKIVSFTSFCGGLPAPDSNDNPFGYKLSWAPRGVLLASRNDASFLRDGKDVFIPGKDLFDNFELVDIPGVGPLEAYPNRNSKQYIDIYGVHDTQTMLRGTFRYPGWCPTIKKMADLGYLDITERDIQGKTYLQLIKEKLGITEDSQVRQKVAEIVHLPVDHKILDNIEWIGLFDNTKTVPQGVNTYLDALCALCKEKLRYAPGERDMLVMRHEFVVDYPDRTENVSSTLLDYGIPNGDSSMSRTVSLPVAIAVRLVLQGQIKLTGLQIPNIPELYNPILNELAAMGINFVERTDKVVPKSNL